MNNDNLNHYGECLMAMPRMDIPTNQLVDMLKQEERKYMEDMLAKKNISQACFDNWKEKNRG